MAFGLICYVTCFNEYQFSVKVHSPVHSPMTVSALNLPNKLAGVKRQWEITKGFVEINPQKRTIDTTAVGV